MEFVIEFAGAFLGAFLGSGLVRRFRVRLPVPMAGLDIAHEHRWDTVRGDGKGPRCGICDKPRGAK